VANLSVFTNNCLFNNFSEINLYTCVPATHHGLAWLTQCSTTHWFTELLVTGNSPCVHCWVSCVHRGHGYQVCLSFHFLFMQRPKLSQSWKLRAFSAISWTYLQSAACTQSYIFRRSFWLLISQNFQTPLYIYTPDFPIKLSD
jgi:hypothetical protein